VIFASLQGGLSFWEVLAIVFRALVYATTLGTAGLMLFAVGFGHQLPETLRRACGAGSSAAPCRA
jgi:hypothetical protein